MTRVQVSREIKAPPERVFATLVDLEGLPARDPDVLGVEVLTPGPVGVGTRFRETRRRGRGQMHTDLEIRDCEAPRRIRFVTESHGTIWDTVYSLEPRSERCALTITMVAQPQRWLPRLINPCMKGVFSRGIAKHLEALGAYCER